MLFMVVMVVMIMLFMVVMVVMIMLFMVVMMRMVVTPARAVRTVVMFFMMRHHFLHKLRLKIFRTLDRFQNIFTFQIVPRCRDDRRFRIMLPYHLHTRRQLLFTQLIRPA